MGEEMKVKVKEEVEVGEEMKVKVKVEVEVMGEEVEEGRGDKFSNRSGFNLLYVNSFLVTRCKLEASNRKDPLRPHILTLQQNRLKKNTKTIAQTPSPPICYPVPPPLLVTSPSPLPPKYTIPRMKVGI